MNIDFIRNLLADPMVKGVLQMMLCLFCGLILTLIIRAVGARMTKVPTTVRVVIVRTICIIIWTITIIEALEKVGVDLMAVLGAAGVAGIAIGFASQTALSNLISGFFLMWERALRLNAYVRVGNDCGVVQDINYLSVSIRTDDNSIVRIPCETFIKNAVYDTTRMETRRCDIQVGVVYGTDWHKLEAVALRTAASLPAILADPVPVFRFLGFGDSSIDISICCWCRSENYVTTRYELARALYEAFNQEGIAFAYPTRMVIQKAE